MSLTTSESAVIELLRDLHVATMATLRERLDLSHMTVVRALFKHGYFTSFNHNATFYVLADTPRFDDDGLWWYRDIGFSRRRTLQATLLALIEDAPAGCTVDELQTRLQSLLGNFLSRLAAQGLIGRMTLARRTVYLSATPQRQARQCSCRDRLTRSATATPAPCLPADLPATTLIELLVQLLRAPLANPASLSQTLQARGTDISADQVRSVFDFYDLKKKAAP